MRPTPADELAALRRILDESVAPALEDEFVRGQLRHVSEAMARLEADWDGTIPKLVAENLALEELLAGIAAVAPSATVVDSSVDATLTVAARNAEHQALRGQLDAAIREIDAAADSGPIRAARSRVHEFLRNAARGWE